MKMLNYFVLLSLYGWLLTACVLKYPTGWVTNIYATNAVGEVGFSHAAVSEKPHLTIVLAYDDLDRNLLTDERATNVGALFSLIKCDHSFLFSYDNSGLTRNFVSGEKGGAAAFRDFLVNPQFIEEREKTKSIQLYFSGIKRSSVRENWKTDNQLNKMKESFHQILKAYDDNLVIQLTMIGSGSGATGLKYLLHEIGEDPDLSRNVYLAKATFFSPVLYRDYYYDNDVSSVLSYPQILAENSIILEMVPDHGYNGLISLPYDVEEGAFWYEKKHFPGTHYNVTGSW